MAEKQNCWEFMECGRQPGGSNTDEQGICPASTALVYDDINGGSNAGRLLLNWSSTPAGTARMFNSRICLILEAGAKLELLEQFETPLTNANTSNIIVQVELGEGAALQHVRLQQEPDEAGLITRTEVMAACSQDKLIKEQPTSLENSYKSVMGIINI